MYFTDALGAIHTLCKNGVQRGVHISEILLHVTTHMYIDVKTHGCQIKVKHALREVQNTWMTPRFTQKYVK